MNPSLAAQRAGLAAALLLGACSSQPAQPAGDVIRTAGNAYAEAEDARAADYAPQEMRTARDKLQAAQELARKARASGNAADMEQARWLAEEAGADASLAEAKAQNTRMHGLLRTREYVAPQPSAAPAPDAPLPEVVPPPPGTGN